jgi:hypothetical protein
MMAARSGHAAIAAALAAAAVLVGVELSRGALGDGALAVPDPCTREVTVDVGGLDGQAQRIGLRALDDAACRLGTSREELLLDAAGSLDERGELPGGTEEAIRDGLAAAIRAERDEGRIGAVTAFLLEQAARRAPVAWVVAAAQRAGGII